VIAISFHQRDRPSSYEQYDSWIKKALPSEEEVYMFGMAAVCWAIWKARNKTCFEKNQLKILKK
jgi:hypothetical protein